MKKLPIKIYLSESHNPWFNLATEDWIFRDMDPEQHILFLWRNSETVVIGRFQNPWKECHTGKLEEDGVLLARRQSGGGAVFQDLGNTNFTFMSGREAYDKNRNNEIILKALADFSIEAAPSGRNDLVIPTETGPRKFSGSAFKETKDRCFHHGTLLINANLQKLANYLNPDRKKLVGKGIESVRSRVVNLSELNPALNHDNLVDRIIHHFSEVYEEQVEPVYLKEADLVKHERLMKYYEFLKDWQWRFGETPQFNHEMNTQLSFGLIDLHLDTQKGMITDCVLYSDSLLPEIIETLANSLKNYPYTKVGLEQALAHAESQLSMFREEIREFKDWLIQQIR